MPRRSRWPAILLLPAPPLSLAYLLAVRAERLSPAFAPVVALAAFPLAAAALGMLALRASPAGERGGPLAVVGVALAELLWAVLAAAMVGFARAWRSG
jgi:hypothetical protein